jgi:hypothetical protein
MRCIILQSEFGERKIPEGEAYTLLKNERIVGVDWTCGGIEQHDVEQELAAQDVPWGTAIAWVAKHALGLQQCSACKAREYLLNHTKENGLLNTAKEILKTFK